MRRGRRRRVASGFLRLAQGTLFAAVAFALMWALAVLGMALEG